MESTQEQLLFHRQNLLHLQALEQQEEARQLQLLQLHPHHQREHHMSLFHIHSEIERERRLLQLLTLHEKTLKWKNGEHKLTEMAAQLRERQKWLVQDTRARALIRAQNTEADIVRKHTPWTNSNSQRPVKGTYPRHDALRLASHLLIKDEERIDIPGMILNVQEETRVKRLADMLDTNPTRDMKPLHFRSMH
jgi:hypothetical protein